MTGENKISFRDETIKIIPFIIFISLMLWIGYFTWNIKFTLPNLSEENKNISSSGTTSTGWEIITGIVIDFWSWEINTWKQEKTNEDYYIDFKKQWNYRSFFPPRQWVVWGNYSTNTQLMNGYLSNNTFQFNLPKKPTNWYLYIRLKKPTNSDIFIYWHWSDKNWYKVSGNLVLEAKYQLSENEYLYKLNDIPYIRFHDKKKDSYNRQSQMSADNNNYIAWFVREYDWSNQISELTVARE